MSKALDLAETIRTRLLTAPVTTGPRPELATAVDLTPLSIIVDRQKNVLSAVTAAVAKAGGTAITILWQGFQTADENAMTPRLDHRYTIFVWSKPIIAGDDLTADDVMDSIVNRLWHWVPGGGHAFKEAKVKNGGLVPNPKFLIYDCEVVIPVSH